MTGHSGRVLASPSTPTVVSPSPGAWTASSRVWDVNAGVESKQLIRNATTINSVSISPDGIYALAGGNGLVAWLWEVETGRELRRLTGHSDVMTNVDEATLDEELCLSRAVLKDKLQRPAVHFCIRTATFRNVNAMRPKSPVISPRLRPN